MRVVYDGRFRAAASSGARDIAMGIDQGLQKLAADSDIELVVAVSQPSEDSSVVVMPQRTFMHVGLPALASKVRADVIVVPRQTRPIASKVPVRPVMLDIGFVVRPDLYPVGRTVEITTKLAMMSRNVTCISEFTADELRRAGYQGTATALPIGAERLMQWRPTTDRPYFLTVGVQRPHKNLAALVRAWNRAETGDFDLVVCARPASDGGAFQREVAASPKSSSIRVVAGLDQEAYDDLLAGAHGHIQPSLYEGLGVPLLNQLAAGVPAIGSSTGHTGAVLGRCPLGLTFDPVDIEDMAASITRLATDSDFRAQASRWGMSEVGVTDWTQVARAAIGI